MTRSQTPEAFRREQGGPPTRRRAWLIGAVLATWVLMAQPALVFATAYSLETYAMNVTPPGEPSSDFCQKSGIVDTARNYGQVTSRLHGGWDCVGTTNAQPSGFMGVRVVGFRNGVSCGTSSWYHNTSLTWAWNLWITMCSNPVGTQTFQTQSHVHVWLGNFYTGHAVGPMSPGQEY